MRSKRLTSEQELADFQHEFQMRTPNPLALEFLRGANVIGYFLNDRLVAGYVINSQFPLRYFGWIPNVQSENQHYVARFRAGDASEICCIWMNKDLVSPFLRNIIYVSLTYFTLRFGKKYVFGGSISPKVAALQKAALPHVIYNGPTTLPGNPVGEIYYARKFEFFWRTIRQMIYDTANIVLHPVAKIGQGSVSKRVGDRI